MAPQTMTVETKEFIVYMEPAMMSIRRRVSGYSRFSSYMAVDGQAIAGVAAGDRITRLFSQRAV